jgi:hypothetical protein
MRRNGTVKVGTYVLTSAAIVFAAPSIVHAESFNARWTPIEMPAPKGDRLDVAVQTTGSKVVFLNDPRGRMTVAQKITQARAPEQKSPVRTVPNAPHRKAPGENAGKAKNAMDGCESSFSPVTVPSMANVAGRCIASLQTTTRIASLSS